MTTTTEITMDAYDFISQHRDDINETRGGMLSETRPVAVRPCSQLQYALSWLPRNPALYGRLEMTICLTAPHNPNVAIAHGGPVVLNALIGTAREAGLGDIHLDGQLIDLTDMKSLANRLASGLAIDEAIRRTLDGIELRHAIDLDIRECWIAGYLSVQGTTRQDAEWSLSLEWNGDEIGRLRNYREAPDSDRHPLRMNPYMSGRRCAILDQNR